jgi:hypothetical protein
MALPTLSADRRAVPLQQLLQGSCPSPLELTLVAQSEFQPLCAVFMD